MCKYKQQIKQKAQNNSTVNRVCVKSIISASRTETMLLTVWVPISNFIILPPDIFYVGKLYSMCFTYTLIMTHESDRTRPAHLVTTTSTLSTV